MKLFTTEDIRAIDRYTIDEEGVSSRELIRRVADGVASQIMARWSPLVPLTVFAGPGNNGADALMVALSLARQGYQPEVLLFNIGGNALSRDCRECRDELLNESSIPFTEITKTITLPELNRNNLVIDGLFGSGLREPLTGGFQALVRYINESGASIVSIDLPSGLMGDWNPVSVNKNIVHATLTLAVQFPRLSFFFKENDELVGEWKLLDIDLSHKAIRQTRTKFHLVEDYDVRCVLPQRSRFAGKNSYGSAMLVAGSYGMMGAAVLAARGALRSGVGRVTVHTPGCGVSVIQTAVPEAIVHPDKHENVFTDPTSIANANAIGVGPGLGTHEYTAKAVDILVKNAKCPLVIDADALNCIAHHRPALLNSLPPMSIITPHAGEFDRLFGQQTSDESRLIKAIEVSRQYNIIVVLKGHYTATIRPDGKVYFNSSGTPALATPGSGDVLTGIITSFLAQGIRPELAALSGVFVHGIAGQIAEERNSEYGVTAGDIAANVGGAIKSIFKA